MTRTLTILLWVLVAAAGATAQTLTRFNSKCYEVYTDMAHPDAKPIAAHMDIVFQEYVNRFRDFNAKNSQAVRMYLFSTRSAYMDYLSGKGINAANTAGIFFASAQEAGLAAWVEGQSQTELLHTLQHEGFHQFAHLRLGDGLPIWVNEGLAEYFGRAFVAKGRMKLGAAPEESIQALVLSIRNKATWGFDAMLTMSGDEWIGHVNKGGPRAGLMYDQAWSMCHFLIHAENGKYTPAFAEFIRMTSRGESAKSAFAKAFKSGDVAPFEAAWKKYMTDTIEPDAVSTAIDRLEFLGAGAEELTKAGVAVETIADLKKELQEGGFRLTRTSEGVKRVWSASDESLFEAPASGNKAKAATLELVKSDRPGVPPGFVVKGLSVTVRAKWEVKKGEARMKVVFE